MSATTFAVLVQLVGHDIAYEVRRDGRSRDDGRAAFQFADGDRYVVQRFFSPQHGLCIDTFPFPGFPFPAGCLLDVGDIQFFVADIRCSPAEAGWRCHFVPDFCAVMRFGVCKFLIIAQRILFCLLSETDRP